jgi:thiosulfate reductase cytochrome b subunit
MTDTASELGVVLAPAPAAAPHHTAIVRVTHWVTTLCVFALLVTGIEVIVSHPRFYWGEEGNVMTPALFSIPIPASRATVHTGYGYVLPDQNGWSRYLHFEAGWVLVLTGLLYVIAGVASGHFRKNLLPRLDEANAFSYNPLQRLSYLVVIFMLFPFLIWTGLAMSPAFVSAVPIAVTALGGRQSARTLHFAVSIALVLFVLVHVTMVWMAGFRSRVMAMVTGRARVAEETN